MSLTRKIRIPSVPYLENKIIQLGAIANPTKDDMQLLAHYKKLMEQRNNEKYSGILEKAW
jgi:hypothetical protein